MGWLVGSSWVSTPLVLTAVAKRKLFSGDIYGACLRSSFCDPPTLWPLGIEFKEKIRLRQKVFISNNMWLIHKSLINDINQLKCIKSVKNQHIHIQVNPPICIRFLLSQLYDFLDLTIIVAISSLQHHVKNHI